MEKLTTPLPDEYSEIDDEEIVMPDKVDTKPYTTQDFPTAGFYPRY